MLPKTYYLQVACTIQKNESNSVVLHHRRIMTISVSQLTVGQIENTSSNQLVGYTAHAG